MENIYLSTVKMLLVLAAMIFVAIVLYRYMGKWRLSLGLGPVTRGQAHGLQKTDTIHLGYRKFVSVVEVEGHVMVIGVGDKEMTLLTQWTRVEKEI
jgi:flagellar biogenesis protein FliO